jgi:hypothetical protein
MRSANARGLRPRRHQSAVIASLVETWAERAKRLSLQEQHEILARSPSAMILALANCHGEPQHGAYKKLTRLPVSSPRSHMLAYKGPYTEARHGDAALREANLSRVKCLTPATLAHA